MELLNGCVERGRPRQMSRDQIGDVLEKGEVRSRYPKPIKNED